MQEPVSIRAHYERFPATVKGAFVLRGEGPDPRQVAISTARVAEVGGRRSHPIDLRPVTLDVAPHLDLFVPFEFAITELGPGWYELVCDVTIDGIPGEVRPGERFSVVWPRATTRRGSVPVGKAVAAGNGKVRIEQVDCVVDSIKILYTSDEPAALRCSADGTSLPVVEESFDPSDGRGKVIAYPLLRSHERLQIDVKGADAPIEIKLS